MYNKSEGYVPTAVTSWSMPAGKTVVFVFWITVGKIIHHVDAESCIVASEILQSSLKLLFNFSV